MTGVFETAALAVAGLTLAACATESASSPADTVSVESPPLAATVLGEEVRTGDAGEMQKIVLTRLFDRYAEEQGIEVTEAEIDAFVENMQRGMRARGLTAEDELTPEEAAQAEQIRRAMGRSMIRQWKLNRALYCEYGGRIIYQQLGPEPLGLIAGTSRSGRPPVTSRSTRRPLRMRSGATSPTIRCTTFSSPAARQRSRHSQRRRGNANPRANKGGQYQDHTRNRPR
jgi:hypothetical protein